ncbi:arabinan endo-1,5-alpha-L-arabinosidase [Croceibacterium sp. TMG7-5b_MA50]|uniref:arabinan endo-1,5-alpha-L-arabinosidase n=1 Tax=Croceibacterium sp. TMG7-5b_MA50 TaxID=3121290 RepID=UPI003221ACF1
MRAGLAAALLAWLACPAAAQETAVPLAPGVPTGDVAPVHDPVVIREGDTYYVFATGRRRGQEGFVPSLTSPDLRQWTAGPSLIAELPAWATQAVPKARDLWAPDISYVNGRYRLYYSVSSFGSNQSAIGLATSATLDPKSPDYGWRDEGLVVQSTPQSDFNAIDPNFVVDRDGDHWLALGSFWTGLKLFRLDSATGKPADTTAEPIAIARRPAPAGGPAPVEAPFIIDHGGWYWLIASYDYCCKGANSTYYTVVGRAQEITGPYLGKDGSSMLEGGGTILLRADLPEQERFRGPGHAGAMRDVDGTDVLVWHAYDKQNNGIPTLQVGRIAWGEDGWPQVIGIDDKGESE